MVEERLFFQGETKEAVLKRDCVQPVLQKIKNSTVTLSNVSRLQDDVAGGLCLSQFFIVSLINCVFHLSLDIYISPIFGW